MWEQPELFEGSTCGQIPVAAAELRDSEAFICVTNSSELQLLSGGLTGAESHAELFIEALGVSNSVYLMIHWCSGGEHTLQLPTAGCSPLSWWCVDGIQGDGEPRWGHAGWKVVSHMFNWEECTWKPSILCVKLLLKGWKMSLQLSNV